MREVLPTGLSMLWEPTDATAALRQRFTRRAASVAASTATVTDLAGRTSTAASRNHRVVSELTRVVGALRESTAGLNLPAPEAVPGGFEMGWDRSANRLELTEWGDWDVEVAQRFVRDFEAHAAQRQPGCTILCDSSRLGPTTPEAQALIEQTVGIAARTQMEFSVIVLQDPLVALQMQRSSEAQGAPIAYAASRAEATALFAAR